MRGFDLDLTRASIAMRNLLRRFSFASRPQTRMTPEQVTALAVEAAAEAQIHHALLGPTVQRIDGRLTWVVGTATIGSGWTIVVDDATGDVEPAKRWGVR